MDALDAALLEAWDEVSKLLKQRPWALARRMERVSRKELRRPVRAWCVALRASDTRFGAHEWRDSYEHACASEGDDHLLTLTGDRLRALCQPVRINPPGVSVREAARLLGRDERTIWSWVSKGRLIESRNAIAGHRPRVWQGPIDPQADDGKGPWNVWGTAWQELWQKIPLDYEQTIERTVRRRIRRGDRPGSPGRSCGWDWKCPGRVLATGQHVPCGRVCKKLWLPLPVWTIGEYLKGRAGDVWEQLPRFEMGRSGFACSKCWGIRFDPVRSEPDEAWNRFVSVISGGLLYGHEVLPPPDVMEALFDL